MVGVYKLTSTLACLFSAVSGEFVLRSSFHDSTRGVNEVNTCKTAMSTLKFNFTPLGTNKDAKAYDAICNYPPAIGSIMICTTVLNGRHDEQFIEVIAKRLETVCDKYSTESHSWDFYYNQYYNATSGNNYIPYNEIKNTSLPIYQATTPKLTQTNFDKYSYLKHYYEQLDVDLYFAVGIVGYFALLILIGAIHNFARRTNIAKSINNSKFSKLCQSYIVFPALFPNGKFAEAYSWKFISALAPNRIQFLVDFFLCMLQLAFYCVKYPTETHRNHLKLVGHRSGILSFGKIPLLVLFSGRNNFLLWLTGWSYSTFLHFHKILSLWMFFDAMLHSIVWTICELGQYVAMMQDTYFACGVAATVLGGVIIGQSLYPFRKLSYEVFLVLHVILAIAFIIMCWYHCNILGWMEWLIAACCVWFFDRLVRVIRMAGFGFRQASLTVVGDNLFKIEVEKPSWVSHTPGHYYYIYFAGWNFWQNHPFTTVQEGNKLCTYVRVKTGMTKRIFNTLSQNGGKMQWKVCYEGPYGGDCAQKFKKYDDSLLIAGGSGVPGVLDSATRVNTGKMVWVVQTLASVNAYRPLLENIHTDLDIFVTRESGTDRECSLDGLFDNSDLDDDSSSKDSSKELEDEKVVAFKTNTVAVTIKYGRPDIQQMVTEYVTNSPSPNVGILACGPPQLMDSLRHVISKNVTTWDKSIDFFDEFQTW
jgi:ferric-chelate reductase